MAVKIIMEDLTELLQDKEKNFKDQKEKGRKKLQVFLCRCIKPETLLTIIYIVCTIYNIEVLFQHRDSIEGST